MLGVCVYSFLRPAPQQQEGERRHGSAEQEEEGRRHMGERSGVLLLATYAYVLATGAAE